MEDTTAGMTEKRSTFDNNSYYRSSISPRSTNLSRRVPAVSVTQTFSSGMLPTYGISNMPINIVPPSFRSDTAIALRENREKEKKELSELNDRFASYVERVRFLEAQNKKLNLEVNVLREKMGDHGNKIKEMYEIELKEARYVIDETNKEKSAMEIRRRKAEDDAEIMKDRYDSLLLARNDDRRKIEQLMKEISNNEAELGLLRRRLKDLEEELKRHKAESQKMLAEIQKITSELYQETTTRMQLQNEKQSLEEEINFLKQIHAQELEDMQQLSFRETALDPSNFFKHELANAIREIRAEYESLNQQQKLDLENWYRIKVTHAIQEVQSKGIGLTHTLQPKDEEELKSLREQVVTSKRDIANMRSKTIDLENQVSELQRIIENERKHGESEIESRDREIDDLRTKLNELLQEYDELISSKSNLDAEISIYRKLLEGEESRDGLRQFAEAIERNARKEWVDSASTTETDSTFYSVLTTPLHDATSPRTVKTVTFKPDFKDNDTDNRVPSYMGRTMEDISEIDNSLTESTRDIHAVEENRASPADQSSYIHKIAQEAKELMKKVDTKYDTMKENVAPLRGNLETAKQQDAIEQMTHSNKNEVAGIKIVETGGGEHVNVEGTELSMRADDDEIKNQQKTDQMSVESRDVDKIDVESRKNIANVEHVRGLNTLTDNEPVKISVIDNTSIRDYGADALEETKRSPREKRDTGIRDTISEIETDTGSIVAKSEATSGVVLESTSYDSEFDRTTESVSDSGGSERAQPDKPAKVSEKRKESLREIDEKDEERTGASPVVEKLITSVIAKKGNEIVSKPEPQSIFDSQRPLEFEKEKVFGSSQTKAVIPLPPHTAAEPPAPEEKLPDVPADQRKSKNVNEKQLEPESEQNEAKLHDNEEEKTLGEERIIKRDDSRLYEKISEAPTPQTLVPETESARQQFLGTGDSSATIHNVRLAESSDDGESKESVGSQGFPSSESIDVLRSSSAFEHEESHGRVLLNLQYDKEFSCLKLTVERAQNLYSNNKCDSYVVCTLQPDKKNRTKKKTPVIKGSANPVWNTLFNFECSRLYLKGRWLELKVKLVRPLFSRETKAAIGKLIIPLNDITLEHGIINQWFSLGTDSSSDSSESVEGPAATAITATKHTVS